MAANERGGTSENLILEEEMDENYEPTEQEITEYAEWLGRQSEIAGLTTLEDHSTREQEEVV